MNITKNKIAAAALALAIAVMPCAYAAEPVAIGDAPKVSEERKTSATSVPGSDWAETYIEKAKKTGLINIGGNYNFPGNINRNDFCELIYNYVELLNNEEKNAAENPFKDTENPHIDYLHLMGIIDGKSETEFAPNDLLTREEAASIIIRLIRKLHPNTVATEMYFAFGDSDDISDWATNAIQTICNMGIMKGVGDNKFAPKDNYTTEQAVATLVRVYENCANIGAESDGTKDTSNLSFADKLNERMPQDKNYMFSPFSIKMALAMAANGADGATKDEILKALDIDDLDAYNKNVKQTLERYSKSDVLKLNVANSIWLNSDNTKEKFVKDFSDKMKEFFSAESGVVTRANALDKINGWVKDKTNDKISSIIDENNLDFMAMLINAVYFKGSWLKDFSEAATADDTFTDRDGNNVQIPFMNQTDYFSYARINDTEVVEMPYLAYDENSDGSKKIDMDISMYLIKSDKDINAEEILNSAEMNRNYVRLSLPKFKTEYGTSLKGMLGELGIDTAFTEMADFDKMLGEKNLQLTDVLHKTYINVDEKGTEAAAVTAAMAGATSMPPEPVSVKFDKPFTYVIMDNTTKDILFMGEYAFAK